MDISVWCVVVKRVARWVHRVGEYMVYAVSFHPGMCDDILTL